MIKNLKCTEIGFRETKLIKGLDEFFLLPLSLLISPLAQCFSLIDQVLGPLQCEDIAEPVDLDEMWR